MAQLPKTVMKWKQSVDSEFSNSTKMFNTIIDFHRSTELMWVFVQNMWLKIVLIYNIYRYVTSVSEMQTLEWKHESCFSIHNNIDAIFLQLPTAGPLAQLTLKDLAGITGGISCRSSWATALLWNGFRAFTFITQAVKRTHLCDASVDNVLDQWSITIIC